MVRLSASPEGDRVMSSDSQLEPTEVGLAILAARSWALAPPLLLSERD
jgi:hypothetical protein